MIPKPLLKTAGILLAICLYSSLLKAAPNDGDTIQLKQPDQSHVTVVIWGDEFYQHVESTDGYTLVRDPQNNWICYAQLNATRDDLSSTDVVYRGQKFADNFSSTLSAAQKNALTSLSKSIKLSGTAINKKKIALIKEMNKNNLVKEQQATGSRNQLVGTVIGLTMLVDFSDEPATISVAEIEKLMNEPGYSNYSNHGSVRDYYLDVSGGKLDYSNIVIGYYRAQKPKTYYDDNSSYAHVPELLGEVFGWAEDTMGFNFSDITLDEFSQMIAVNVFYAGVPESGWSKGLWPHRWYYNGFNSNGVLSNNYELSDIGSSLSIGTICHENGHMLFTWPDLYDYGNDGFQSNGVGRYCLMAYGSLDKNPVPPNAWLRADAGWDSVMTFNSTYATYSHVANSNTSYKYTNPDNPAESYFIESRRKKDRNILLPDQGLMIWHIDEDVWGNEAQDMLSSDHFECSLLQADGFFHLENGSNYGNSGDLYKGTFVDSCGGNTNPSTDWWSGDDSYLEIHNVSNVEDTMTFDVGIFNYSIPEINKNQVSIYPNPSKGTVTINFKEPEPAMVQLYDLTGKEAYSAQLNSLSNKIDISSLENGLYVMKVVSEKHSYHYKLVKQ